MRGAPAKVAVTLSGMPPDFPFEAGVAGSVAGDAITLDARARSPGRTVSPAPGITASPFERSKGRREPGALGTPGEWRAGAISFFERGRRLSACSLAVAHLQFDGM